MEKLNNLNKLRKTITNKGVEIVYINIPGKLPSVYVEGDQAKFIMVHNDIEGTQIECEELALSLGYITAMKKLGLQRLNTFDVDKNDTIKADKLARTYQKRIIQTLTQKEATNE